MHDNTNIGIHNKFDIIRRNAKTGEIIGEYKAENIILNNLWAYYISANVDYTFRYIHFGSGIVTPIATDVKLGTWLGYKLADNTAYDVTKFWSDGIVSLKKSIRLEDTEFNGSTISEVGYSGVTSSTTGLHTKALIKDQNGNIVTIPKIAGEVLDIFGTVYFKFTLSSQGDKIKWARPSLVKSYSSGAYARGIWSALVTRGNWSGGGLEKTYLKKGAFPSQHSSDPDSGENAYSSELSPVVTYDVPNKKVMFTIPNITAAIANNSGGITGIILEDAIHIKLPNSGCTQPVIIKEVLGTGDGATKDWNPKFGYLKDNGTFKLYYNDVEQAGATFDPDLPVPPLTPFSNIMKMVDYSKIDDATGMELKSPALGAATIYSSNGGWFIFENPVYDTIGILSVALYGGGKLECSDSPDINGTWVNVPDGNVAIGSQNKRYWKATADMTDDPYMWQTGDPLTNSNWANKKLIHGATPAPNGATVSVTYDPDCIAKDDQHVLNNIVITLTFNEYTPS